MTSSHGNANDGASHSARSSHLEVGPLPKGHAILLSTVSFYYLVSTISLPFINVAWISDIPILGIVQLPKMFLKSILQGGLMSAMNYSGLSRGSYSPDYLDVHGWAMGMMMTAPAFLVSFFLLLRGQFSIRQKQIVVLLVMTISDAVVTICIDQFSSLSVYNDSFF